MSTISYSSEQSKERILASAKQEFLLCGFEKANLRRIAENAHVTTGALYNYYAGKDAIFDALVSGVADEMFAQFRLQHETAAKAFTQNTGSDWSIFVKNGGRWIIDYIYRHFDEVKLLLCCSEGTRWSDYLEPFIELEERAYSSYFRTIAPQAKLPSEFFFHCTASAGFEFVAHAVEHDLSYEESLAFLIEQERFRLAGWRELMG